MKHMFAINDWNGAHYVIFTNKNTIVVDFHFIVVSYRGEWQLPGTFFGMKKYCS